MDKEEEQTTENTADGNRPKTPALEWLTAAFGLLLVVGTIGYLLFDAVTEKDSPPQVVVEAKEIIPVQNGYLVKFSVENKGDNHAAEVEIEGKLMDGEKEKESSSVGIGYAPSHSQRSGGMFFTENPREFKLELRALGYTEP